MSVPTELTPVSLTISIGVGLYLAYWLKNMTIYLLGRLLRRRYKKLIQDELQSLFMNPPRQQDPDEGAPLKESVH